MTNKTLLITAIIILIVGAGAFALYRNSQKSDSYGEVKSDEQTGSAASEQEQAMQNTEQEQKDNGLGCTRSVDQAALTAPSINIQNKFVTLDVKDFGKIKIQLYDKDAPKTVENFLRLTSAGYYNCISFHRISKGFVIQGGDPTGTGAGGDSAFGGEFADELNPATPSYKAGYVKGVVAMANRGPNTNTSQFFIMLGDVPLPHSYTIFGKVVSGLDAVTKIEAVEIVPQMGPTDGAPVTPIVIQTAVISDK
jgi:cyclophilin family peptidyl-prolyl cis-trans isomerase